MKRAICLLVVCLLCGASCPAYALDTSARSAVLIEGEHGTVIYEKNASQRLSMASTTKIMTAICAIEEGNLDKKVKIAPEAVGVEGSSIYLKNGESFTLRELVCGLMLNSGNDAAVAIAYAVSGGVDKFSRLMNEKAKKIGAKNTQFKNPNGLDEEGHYTTAYDLALIAAYGLKNEEFKKIVSTHRMTIGGEGETEKRYLTNHNKLLNMYDGCIGVKTGFTKKSGRCLVSAAQKNGVILVAVTLSAPDDWRDHTNMLNFGFDELKRKNVVSKGEPLGRVFVVNGKKAYTKIVAGEDFDISLLPKTRCVTYFFAPDKIKAPVKKDDKVGEIVVYLDGKQIKTVPAVAKDTVSIDDTRYFAKTLANIIREFTDFDSKPHNDK